MGCNIPTWRFANPPALSQSRVHPSSSLLLTFSSHARSLPGLAQLNYDLRLINTLAMFARTVPLLRTSARALTSTATRSAAASPMALARTSSVALKATTQVAMRRMYSSVSDTELLSVLNRELKYEQENSDKATPAFLAEFHAKKTFSIQDRPGENEVVLSREFGSEKITLTFSIDDVANVEPIEGTEEVAFPVSVVITVTKKAAADAGAVTFQTIADGGAFQITNITFNDDSVLATMDTAEADYKRRGTYVGPIFDELDDNLSNAFYQYLEARGVGAELAEFIPAYVEYKEQLEYNRWLQKVSAFVERK
ncbi:mitochondrial glyco protein [Catenaria anguillulae PL171]|uniref:Mitochondrial glyco protein n=1 Tax=Catenaria anguillulae PL171 TaxID=765915 RepID=A0A1Y2HFK9_9FUNG|nr:mitochondrial glyco protein [Catenaria anguillulae PL171]